MVTLQDKLDNIYQTKLEIKSAIGTDSDVFSEYPAMIRNMSGGGGVSYSYLDERLSYYVETSDLESMGYATESYVLEAISNIPSTDTSSYVTYTYLESKEYITINDVPTVDTSSYVTYTYLESKEYLTEIPSDYATYEAISGMGYITYSYGDSIYVSYAYIGDLNEITEYILGSSSGEAPENVYATKYELGSYVSKDELNNAAYITINDVPTVDTSSYVTYTYLESKEYLTEIPNTYATYAAISEMGYITSNDLPVINKNIIPKENNIYTLGDASYQYAATYTNRSYLGEHYLNRDSASAITMNINGTNRFRFAAQRFNPYDNNYCDLGAADYRWANTYSTKYYTGYNCDIHSNSNYNIYFDINGSEKFVINSLQFNFLDNNNRADSSLGTSSQPWGATYTQNLYLNGTNIEDRFTNLIWTGTSAEYALLPDYTSYQIYMIKES